MRISFVCAATLAFAISLSAAAAVAKPGGLGFNAGSGVFLSKPGFAGGPLLGRPGFKGSGKHFKFGHKFKHGDKSKHAHKFKHHHKIKFARRGVPELVLPFVGGTAVVVREVYDTRVEKIVALPAPIGPKAYAVGGSGGCRTEEVEIAGGGSVSVTRC